MRNKSQVGLSPVVPHYIMGIAVACCDDQAQHKSKSTILLHIAVTNSLIDPSLRQGTVAIFCQYLARLAVYREFTMWFPKLSLQLAYFRPRFQSNAARLPYHVIRNSRGSLPVYSDIRNAGTRYLVQVRNIEGDANVNISYHSGLLMMVMDYWSTGFAARLTRHALSA
jgi:Mitochondrial large subunit ribosomal protein (Img2)